MILLKFWKEITSVVLAGIIIGTQFAYYKPLFNYSLDVIADWQKRVQSKGFDKACIYVSHLGYEYALGAVFVLAYNLLPRNEMLKFAVSYYVALNAIMFGFIAYQDPRPYYVKDEIEAKECVRGYGNPSGHMVGMITIYGTLLYIVFNNKISWGIPEALNTRWKKLLVMWIFIVLYVCMIAIVWLARMYLGSHALDQLTYGALIGLWALFTVVCIFNEHLDRHLRYVFENGKQREVTLGKVVIFEVILLILMGGIAFYLMLRDTTSDFEEEWKPNIRRKCPKQLESIKPLPTCLMGIILAFLFGLIYFGQMKTSSYFEVVYKHWHFPIGFWKMCARILLSIIIFAISFIPYAVTMKSSSKFILGVGEPLTEICVIFISIPLLDFLCLKLKLVNIPDQAKQTTSIQRQI